MSEPIKRTMKRDSSQQRKAKEASTVYPVKQKSHAKRRKSSASHARMQESVQDAELAKERRTNNLAYERLKSELEKRYHGKWVCIAFGKFQATADDWIDLNDTAPSAKHRIITQIGANKPRHIRLPFRYRVGRFIR